jgi:hypothetical protein
VGISGDRQITKYGNGGLYGKSPPLHHHHFTTTSLHPKNAQNTDFTVQISVLVWNI